MEEFGRLFDPIAVIIFFLIRTSYSFTYLWYGGCKQDYFVLPYEFKMSMFWPIFPKSNSYTILPVWMVWINPLVSLDWLFRLKVLVKSDPLKKKKKKDCVFLPCCLFSWLWLTGLMIFPWEAFSMWCLCMFYLCLHIFSPVTQAPSHISKTHTVGWWTTLNVQNGSVQLDYLQLRLHPQTAERGCSTFVGQSGEEAVIGNLWTDGPNDRFGGQSIGWRYSG